MEAEQRGLTRGETFAIIVSMSRVRIDIPSRKLTEFCNRWNIVEFAFFGSVLRDDFSETSDIDVLVSFAPGSKWTLFDHVDMQHELEEIFERQVDLVTRQGLERSRNRYRRNSILESLEVADVTA